QNNIFNLNELKFKSKKRKLKYYNMNSSKLTSKDLGSEKLFFDVKELLPGQLSYPYHFHSDNEEVFIILEGEATLRQNNKKRKVKKGDLIFFPNRLKGAHQLFNHTDQMVRYLDLTTNFGNDICCYPDSKKINAGSGNIFKIEDKVDYFAGEEEKPKFWK
ncbi:MAG: cupin domain-containing protein, partial [Spirochaetes bacterium]|nr:cupin domain-containing protein [Spirochaetota bacterium]